MTALLLTYLRPLWRRVLLLALMLLGGIALALLAPQSLRRFVDTAAGGGAERELLSAAGLFLALTIGRQAAQTAASYLSEDVGWRATNHLRADLAAHCLRLDMAFHHQHTPGALISRVDGDVNLLAKYFSRLVIELIGNVLLVVGVTVLLFREWWAFGLVAAAYGLLFAGFYRAVRPYLIGLNKDDRQSYADLVGFLEEALVTKEDVKGVGAGAHIFNRLYGYLRRRLQVDYRMAAIVGTAFNTSYMLFVLSTAAVLYLGATRYRAGEMTIGAVFLAAYYVGLLESPMNLIRRQVTGLYQAAAGFSRVREFLDRPPAIDEPDSPPDGRLASPLGVDFEDVTFGYSTAGGEKTVEDEEREAAVRHVTFHLPPGQTLGLLGRTGSGKSTLTRLLFRLYDPAAGTIRLDGKDLRRLPLAELRRGVGLVTQEVQLFAASVRDNLTFFSPDYRSEGKSDERLLSALAELGLGAWIEGLPEGLDTRLGSDGQGLSAGQAQLLALARVFLRDPGLVVLDEASSRLDPATERLLEGAVERLLAGRTAIIIAHRLSTVQQVDQILILAGGVVQEYGARSALAADPDSHFSHLLRTGLATEEAD